MTPATKLVDGVAVPLDDADLAQIEADRANPPRAADRLIAKTRIYRRATDVEIATFLGFFSTQATPRQRLMWEDAEGGLVYVSDVLPLAQALFGEARAAELLAP